jgi:hypothetical protein
MGRYRIYLVSAVSILALVGMAMMLMNTIRYYPLVHVVLPDQSELIFIDLPWGDQKKCSEANQNITNAIAKNCSQCKLISRCDKQLEPLLQAVLTDKAGKDYVVQSGTLRIVVKAGNAAKDSCVVMAQQITIAKKQTARCVFPAL